MSRRLTINAKLRVIGLMRNKIASSTSVPFATCAEAVEHIRNELGVELSTASLRGLLRADEIDLARIVRHRGTGAGNSQCKTRRSQTVADASIEARLASIEAMLSAICRDLGIVQVPP